MLMRCAGECGEGVQVYDGARRGRSKLDGVAQGGADAQGGGVAGGQMDVVNAALSGKDEAGGEKSACQPPAAALGQDAGADLTCRGVDGEMEKAEKLPILADDAEAGIALELQARDVAGNGMVGMGAGEASVTVVAVQRQQVVEDGRSICGGELADG